MFLFIILFSTLHLAISLQSTDYCIRTLQECKLFNDKNQTKCDSKKCPGTFSIACESNVCAKNKIKCIEYKNALSKYLKIIKNIQTSDPLFAAHYLKEKNKIQTFNKYIKVCQINNEIYEFSSNDFCVNGKKCIETIKDLKGFGFNYRSIITTKKFDCRCPIKKNYKCGYYCTIDHIACGYYNLLNNKTQFGIINECSNHNITTFRFINNI